MKTKTNLPYKIMLGIFILVAACLYRVLSVNSTDLANIAPIMALCFGGAIYLPRKCRWIPFGALTLSDLWLNWFYSHHYGYAFPLSEMLVRIGVFAVGVEMGVYVSHHKSWLTILGGTLAASLLFYLATNTMAWSNDSFYAKSFAGWIQAMTVGHPEYPSTFFFFRNTLTGDLIFTGIFAAVMESIVAGKSASEPSSLSTNHKR